MSWPLLGFRLARIEARSHLTPAQRRSESDKDLRFWTNVGLSLAVLIGVAIIVAHGGVRTAGLAAFGAALGTGGVLGFLFGVPNPNRPVNISGHNVAIDTGHHSRAAAGGAGAGGAGAGVPPGTGPSGPAQAAPDASWPDAMEHGEPASPEAEATFRSAEHELSRALKPALSEVPDASAQASSAAATVPTRGGGDDADLGSGDPGGGPPSEKSNLEQVADWVTKLLLGGGLTQISRIPPKIWQWSQTVAMGITPPSLDQRLPTTQRLILANQSFAAGVLVYGFILGFFSGFLITKLQLGRAISD